MSATHLFPAEAGGTPLGAAPPNRLAMATAERTELAELLAGLTPEEWEEPSLCHGWSVRDVAVHVISYDHLGVAAVVARMARGGFGVHGANAIGVAERADLRPDGVLAAYRDHLAPRGLTAVGGARIGFLDGVIHHQDIRRALGRPRSIPVERLVQALDDAPGAPVIPARRLMKGLRFTATDVAWEHGSGPEVRGPAEAVLLAVAGRTSALTDLDGPGLGVLGSRSRDLARREHAPPPTGPA